jgi:hypothetical protein
MTRDDEISALLRVLEAEKRREIEQLVIPSWDNEAEVDRAANQRIHVEAYSEFCESLICSGHYQRSGEPFVFMPDLEMEWLPHFEDDLATNWTKWDDFADALRSGRKKEVARLAHLLRKNPPPKRILDLIADFLQEKNKAPANRPPKVDARPSNEMWALKYYQLLRLALRDMYPTQKASEVRRRAKKIAAATYKVTLDDLKRLTSVPKSKRR